MILMTKPRRGRVDALAAPPSRNRRAGDAISAAFSASAFARARRKPVLCLAHVTNQMAVSGGDFEKGEADGAYASLSVIAAVARAWREMKSGSL
jgi:hypothetical protein